MKRLFLAITLGIMFAAINPIKLDTASYSKLPVQTPTNAITIESQPIVPEATQIVQNTPVAQSTPTDPIIIPPTAEEWFNTLAATYSQDEFNCFMGIIRKHFASPVLLIPVESLQPEVDNALTYGSFCKALPYIH